MSDSQCRMGKVREYTMAEAHPFLKRWHYMSYLPTKTTIKYWGYDDESGNIACIIAYNPFPVNQYVAKKMFGDDWKDYLKVWELSRMACRDECPKFTESMFLGRILKQLRRLGCDAVVSYADMEQKHEGVIYRATGWFYTGLAAPNPKFLVDGCITGKSIPPSAPCEPGCTWPVGNRIEVNWRQCRHKWGKSHEGGLRPVLGDRLIVQKGFGKHRFVKPLTRKALSMFKRENVVA